jgi:hypothetical protein
MGIMPFLDGDGACMAEMNPGGPTSYWCCDVLQKDWAASLGPKAGINEGLHPGEFLSSIPLAQRVGDMAHCRAQIGTKVKEGLERMVPHGIEEELKRWFRDMRSDMVKLPDWQRGPKRPTSDADMTLSEARYFFGGAGVWQNLCDFLGDQGILGGDTVMYAGQRVGTVAVMGGLMQAMVVLSRMMDPRS